MSIKPVSMEGCMPEDLLFLLCKNLTLSEKEAGTHSFKNRVTIGALKILKSKNCF